MDRKRRKLAGLAVSIRDDLARLQHEGTLPAFPNSLCGYARRASLLLQRSRDRGWNLSTQRLQENFSSSIIQFERELSRIREQLTALRSPQSLALPSEIYHDLVALDEETEELTWNRTAGTVSVQTEVIELEGRYLGAFQIDLCWRKIGQGMPYRVIALDPQPAAGNSSVTHPHVLDEHVCEGDATLPIQVALASGRLWDFFTIIRQLLQTYNSASPYVALERWDGAACHECDTTVYEDDGCLCDRCEALMCDDCYRRCSDCGEPCCSECSLRCAGCQEDVCHRCHRSCADCDEEFCESCLTDDERCHNCHEDQVQQEASPADSPPSPLQSDRLGETVVPA